MQHVLAAQQRALGRERARGLVEVARAEAAAERVAAEAAAQSAQERRCACLRNHCATSSSIVDHNTEESVIPLLRNHGAPNKPNMPILDTRIALPQYKLSLTKLNADNLARRLAIGATSPYHNATNASKTCYICTQIQYVPKAFVALQIPASGNVCCIAADRHPLSLRNTLLQLYAFTLRNHIVQ